MTGSFGRGRKVLEESGERRGEEKAAKDRQG